jgi:hypothetical protein
MKFLLAIFCLVGLATSQMVEQSQSPIMDASTSFNHSQCIFRPEDRIFSCRGADAISVECGAVGEFGDRKFSVFGMGMIPDAEGRSVESMRYWLYPRSLNGTTYANRTVAIEGGRLVDLILWAGERAAAGAETLGIRITDLKCYERLVRMFAEASRQPHMVRLEAGPQAVQEVPLFGEVLIMDKNVQKRWLWGYGWGLGGLGWGWGGLGWGWPYGGLWWGK